MTAGVAELCAHGCTPAVAVARSPSPHDDPGSSGSPAAVGASPARAALLANAVDRVEDCLTRGALAYGHRLPDGFALERARNIVTALLDLLLPEEFGDLPPAFDLGGEGG